MNNAETTSSASNCRFNDFITYVREVFQEKRERSKINAAESSQPYLANFTMIFSRQFVGIRPSCP